MAEQGRVKNVQYLSTIFPPKELYSIILWPTYDRIVRSTKFLLDRQENISKPTGGIVLRTEHEDSVVEEIHELLDFIIEGKKGNYNLAMKWEFGIMYGEG